MNKEIKSYKDLIIWQKSLDLAGDIYRLIKTFPENEKFLLCSQLQRCAISVPSNIAEGQARRHPKEFRRFLYIALGSLAEIDTQLIIAYRLKYLSENDLNAFQSSLIELQKMIKTLISKLTTNNSKLTTLT